MDIIVEGIGKKYYTPEEVEIKMCFNTKEDSYERALSTGTKHIEVFIEKVMKEMQFDKKELKTKNFRIIEQTIYDPEQKKHLKDGYLYSQESLLKFDYSIEKIADFMEKTSKLENAPRYSITFNVKDIKQCKSEALEEAYNMAKDKAEAIANAAGKELKECIKIDFMPFGESIVSSSRLNNINTMYGLESERGIKSVQNTIQTIFTPEDVLISETLYCLWTTN